MLKKAKPKFESDIKQLIEDSMYNAFISTFSKGDEDVIDAYLEKALDESAKKFARKVSEKAATPLADAIDEYIKSMGIFITVQPLGISLTGPTGPVSGVINITPQTSNITIQ